MMFASKMCAVAALSFAAKAAQETCDDEVRFMGNPLQKWLVNCDACKGNRYQYDADGKKLKCPDSGKSLKCEKCKGKGKGDYSSLGLHSKLYDNDPQRSEWYDSNAAMPKNCVLIRGDEIVAQCQVQNLGGWRRTLKDYHPFKQGNKYDLRIEAVHVPEQEKGKGYGTRLVTSVINKIQTIANESTEKIKIGVYIESSPFEDHEFAMRRVNWYERMGFKMNTQYLDHSFQHLRNQQVKKDIAEKKATDMTAFVTIAIDDKTGLWRWKLSDGSFTNTLDDNVLLKFKKEHDRVMNEPLGNSKNKEQNKIDIANFEHKYMGLLRGVFLFPLQLEITRQPGYLSFAESLELLEE